MRIRTMRVALTYLVLLAASSLVGCASHMYAPEKEDIAAKNASLPNDRAVVYAFHGHGLVGHFANYGFAVNGKVVGENATNGYLRLELPIGRHRFRSYYYNGVALLSPEIDLLLEPGKEYYFEQSTRLFGGDGPYLDQIAPSVGQVEIAKRKHSRFDVRNLTINKAIEARITSKQVQSSNSTNLPQRAGATNISPSLDIGSFLEGVATVFLVGLAIYGAVHSGNTYTPQPIPDALLDRPAIVRAADSPKGRYEVSKSYITTSGDTYTATEDRVYSPTRGESWTVSGNTIRGTDGSRYQISGNKIYSETGQVYQVNGNRVSGSDGSLCSVSGNLINCSK